MFSECDGSQHDFTDPYLNEINDLTQIYVEIMLHLIYFNKVNSCTPYWISEITENCESRDVPHPLRKIEVNCTKNVQNELGHEALPAQKRW